MSTVLGQIVATADAEVIRAPKNAQLDSNADQEETQ